MQRAVLCLLLTIAVAVIGFAGVPETLEWVIQLAFFSLLVVFVYLMVRHLAQDR